MENESVTPDWKNDIDSSLGNSVWCQINWRSVITTQTFGSIEQDYEKKSFSEFAPLGFVRKLTRIWPIPYCRYVRAECHGDLI